VEDSTQAPGLRWARAYLRERYWYVDGKVRGEANGDAKRLVGGAEGQPSL